MLLYIREKLGRKAVLDAVMRSTSASAAPDALDQAAYSFQFGGMGYTNDIGDQPRSWPAAMKRGLRQRCPACGEGKLYKSYLKVNDTCPQCHEELHHHRADDAPPYFTIFIVAHIVGLGILWTEQAYAPPTWVHWIIWMPLLLVLSLWLLPRIKGALIALQWALRMHGFGGAADEALPEPLPAADADPR